MSADLLALLDRSEAEVIILAEALGADEVLQDDRAARAVAITGGKIELLKYDHFHMA